jgi:hypothetical protein
MLALKVVIHDGAIEVVTILLNDSSFINSNMLAMMLGLLLIQV